MKRLAIIATALLLGGVPASAGCYNILGDMKTNNDCILRDMERSQQQQQMRQLEWDAFRRDSGIMTASFSKYETG
jgi:hypothetical protein